MSEEEYNNRIGKINAEISTDRVDADRGHYLLLQKLYLKDRYIEDLQQKVEQLVLEIEQLRTELNTKDNIINELEIISGNRMNTILEIEKYCNDEKEDLIAGGEVCEDILKIIDELKEDNQI